MHCRSAFREERLDVLHGLMTAHPLATLITAGSNGLEANLMPFTLHAGGEHGILRAHLARGHSQLDALQGGAEALIVFQGPECYVTPAWYPSKAEHGKVVPTWNFAMVQARGKPVILDDATWVRAQIEELTNNHEGQRASPWKVADAPDDFIAAQLKALVGIEIPIRSIEGKWKVSQNRLPADRQGVIDGLRSEQVCPSMLATMEAR
ncbi:FMN-binding negative transcriptional regulator [Rugamonas apoptosis]|uniref:FMN-binding negative transcriptional regulator n=1 Tax=Rugamonas apoptosis TaxID=2758570 RepID=A0A7W2FC86_9BURK|nr:FMN-binding negative transcriptional regulator [Rugamonas apoptosis]MBA5689068.1 FMN-binding negative transcriptional regulator [Rugamonas apoptosis]